MLLMHQGKYRPDMESESWADGEDSEAGGFSLGMLLLVPWLLLLALGPYLKVSCDMEGATVGFAPLPPPLSHRPTFAAQEQLEEEVRGIRTAAGIPLHVALATAGLCLTDYFLCGGIVAQTWLSLLLYPFAAYFTAKVAAREGVEVQHRVPVLFGIATVPT